MRVAVALVVVVAMSIAACVDGKTPDCSTPDSGCAPADGTTPQPDGSDASGQSDASDASSDGTPSDSGDAATG
jgi:hypothetical protein